MTKKTEAAVVRAEKDWKRESLAGMTPVNKPVTRITIGVHRGRQLVATLGPGDVLYLRQKGRRQVEGIDLASCYDIAVKRRIARELFEKAASIHVDTTRRRNANSPPFAAIGKAKKDAIRIQVVARSM
jgi:hypothetical protein